MLLINGIADVMEVHHLRNCVRDVSPPKAVVRRLFYCFGVLIEPDGGDDTRQGDVRTLELAHWGGICDQQCKPAQH